MVTPPPPPPPPPRIKNPLNDTPNGPLMVTVTKGEKRYLTVTKKTDGRYLVTTRSNKLPRTVTPGPYPTLFFGQRAAGRGPDLLLLLLLLPPRQSLCPRPGHVCFSRISIPIIKPKNVEK